MPTPIFNYRYLNVPGNVLFTDIGIFDEKIVVSGLSNNYYYNNNISAIRVAFQTKTVTSATFLNSNHLQATSTVWLSNGEPTISTGTITLDFYKTTDLSTHTVKSNTVVVGTATEIFGAYERILEGVDDFFVIPNTHGKSTIFRSYFYSSTAVNHSITISSTTSFAYNCIDGIYADPNFIYVITDNNGSLSKITTGGTTTVLTTGIYACGQYSVTSSVAYFAGDNGKVLRIKKSTNSITNLSYSGSAVINALAVSDDGKVALVGDSGTVVVMSGTTFTTYGTTGAKILSAIEYYSDSFYVAGDGIFFDFASQQLTGAWDISFEGIDFLSNGIYAQTWNDNYKKGIMTEPNKVTHGGFSNRFSYFGLNQIDISGYIMTASISAITKLMRNKTSYGYGRLYKRSGIYTNAELKEFDIDSSKNGHYYTFNAKFYGERPYYYKELNIGTETNFNFENSVSPKPFYSNLAIDIDDVEISYLGSITATVNYFITTGYDVLCTKNDSSPTTSNLTISDWGSVSYLDNNQNSIGIRFLYSTTIKRFYVRGSNLSLTYPHYIFDDFDIYYKDASDSWVLFDDPYIVKIKKIRTLGNVLLFDNMNINTKELKINFNKTATRNLIDYSDNRSKVISFIVPEKFSMIQTSAFSMEFRVDTKSGEVWKDGSRYSAIGQLLKLYSDLTNFWTFVGGSKTLKVVTNYKQTYFPV